MTTTEKKTDGNSSTNQRIKEKFVEQHVLTCFSYEMGAILKASAEQSLSDLPTWDDIENAYEYVCPECGNGQSEPFDFEAQSEDFDAECKYKCYECDKEFDEAPESQPQEIYEWWIVSRFLTDKLRARNECMLEFGNNVYWGRTCTGQAILLDGSITDICREMEILDEQKYSWKKAVSNG